MSEIKTFEDDFFQLKGFGERLTRFIKTETKYVDDGLVIALNSPFGFGKSTFLNMWSDYLTTDNAKEILDAKIIRLNAWESDYYGDPLFAIISKLLENFDRAENSSQFDKLKEGAQDIGSVMSSVGVQLLEKATGVNPDIAAEAGRKAKTQREDFTGIATDAFSLFEKRKEAMIAIKKALEGLIEENSRVLFMVDELDRCRPDYAISYLETIKHIFDIKGAIFVIAADRHHLENSARKAFGEKLEFDEYYRKFIHREVNLPEVTSSGYSVMTSEYLDKYLPASSERQSAKQINKERQYREENICNLIEALNLTPRQTKEALRVLGHLLDTERNLMLNYILTGITMSVIRIGNHQMYLALKDGNLSCEQMSKLIKSLEKEDAYTDWWATFLYTGGATNLSREEFVKEAVKFEIYESEEIVLSQIKEWSGQSNWGRNSGDSNKFALIYEKIEQIYQWD